MGGCGVSDAGEWERGCEGDAGEWVDMGDTGEWEHGCVGGEMQVSVSVGVWGGDAGEWECGCVGRRCR